MATWQAQIEALLDISLTTSETPSTTQVGQYLVDGATEVINRIVELKPEEASLFGLEQTIDSSSGITLPAGKLLSVIRENGVSQQWEPCSKISETDKWRATDINSLSYKSKYNPGFYVNDNTLYIVPTPDGVAERGKATFVSYPSEIAVSTDAITFNDNSSYFPSKYNYLIVLYASMKSVMHMMATIFLDPSPPSAPTAPDAPGFILETITEENIDSVTVGSVTVGTDTTVSSVVLASPSVHTLSAPTYTKPTIATRQSFNDFFESGSLNPFDDNDPGDFTINALLPEDATISIITYTGPTSSSAGSITAADTYVAAPSVIAAGVTLPTYTKPTVSFDIAKFEEFLETEEDSELAQVQLGRLNLELQEWQNDITNELNEFNKENAIYQAGIQEAITEAQMASTKAMKQADIDLQRAISNSQEANKVALQNATNEMQKIMMNNDNAIKDYTARMQGYSAEVQAEVEEHKLKITRYSTELQSILTAWNQTQGIDLQIFNADIQSELNEFNKENAAFQASIQEEIQNLQVASSRVQKQAEIELSEVQKQADIDMQKAVKDGDYSLQIGIQNKNNDLQAKIHNSAKDLEMQISEYTQTLALYNAELQEYSIDVQEYSVAVQEASFHHKERQERFGNLYAQLKADYDAAFMIGQKPAQQEGRERRRRR
tara:strand:+ start:5247 stop:7235 length:1989 start_codon:yes stop_codon:yes gene_type:complete